MTKLLLSWNEMRERARKMAHNSVVKIRNYRKRDEYVKVMKNSGTDLQTPLLDLDPSV